MGDFNAPDINWSSMCCNSHYSTSLCDFVFDYNLSQVIQIPTYTGGNILDIVLTKAVFNVIVASFSPLRSDHFAVTFRLSYVPVTSSSSAKSLFDYSKADWTGLLEYLLNYDFDLLFHDDDNDIVWESFKDLFLSSLHMYVPVVVSRSAANYTPWFNGPLNHKLKCLRTLKRRYAANPTLCCNRGCLKRNWHLLSVIGSLKAHMR